MFQKGERKREHGAEMKKDAYEIWDYHRWLYDSVLKDDWEAEYAIKLDKDQSDTT